MLVLSTLSLAAAVAATPMGSYLKSLNKRDVSITDSQLNELKFYAQHSAAAYCNYNTPAGANIKCGGECPDLEANQVRVVDSLVGDDTGIGAYVSSDTSRQEIVLSVRGSNNIRNFITDVKFKKEDCTFGSGCEYHDGFGDAWNELQAFAHSAISKAISEYPSYSIRVTGHSLGAAVATIAAADLRNQGHSIDLYNYGSPRVGNDVFANYVTNQPGTEYRVTHLDDPVPRLPPMFLGYRHTTPEYWLSTGDSNTTDYTVGDVKVCPGIANADCNAGTDVGLDIPAHLHYFEAISGCGSGGDLEWKRDVTDDDQEVSQRLSQWAVKDQEYSKGL